MPTQQLSPKIGGEHSIKVNLLLDTFLTCKDGKKEQRGRMSLRVDTLDPQNQTGDIVRENVQSPEIFFLKEHTGKAAVISTSNIPFYQFEKEE